MGASLDEGAWKRIDVRDGSKGPLVVDVVKRRVGARTPRRQQGDEELLVVLRYRDRDNQQVVKVDFYLSNAAWDTTGAVGPCGQSRTSHRRMPPA